MAPRQKTTAPMNAEKICLPKNIRGIKLPVGWVAGLMRVKEYNSAGSIPTGARGGLSLAMKLPELKSNLQICRTRLT
jgi:hypothetical protein